MGVGALLDGLVRPLRRAIGFAGIGVRRAIGQARGPDAGRFWSRVGGVALAVALMLIVTAIGVGIATQSTVYSDDVDYWITPETEGGSSVLVDADAPQFGSVHPTTDRIDSIESVRYTTPVMTQALRIESERGEREYVLAIGVINTPALDRVSDVQTAGLVDGDPYYDGGTYDGEWTGEMVLSSGTASLLNASTGESVTALQPQAPANRSFVVAGIDDGSRQGSQFPIVVMQLSELQTMTGADANDQADQFLVGADSPSVQSELASIYPRSTIQSRSGLTSQQVLDEQLPLALAITAFLIAVVIGTLFVMTMTGMEVTADRTQLGTLAAIGLSTRSRFGVLAVQTFCITLVGGAIGVVLGFGGIELTNRIATETLTSVPVATREPFLIAYGLGVSVVIALLSLPYIAVLLRRVGTVSEVTQ